MSPLNNSRREKPTPKPGQSWGIFGGEFDPIHHGHLNLARQVRSIKGLDGVVIVPSIKPPHRDSLALSPFADRLAMVSLATEELPYFLASSVENDMNLSGFTLDTIRTLQQMFPGINWHLIVGADQGEVFDTWHQPDEILKEARLLVGARPGYEPRLPTLKDTSRVEIISIPLIDLSSTDIRHRVSTGMTKSDLSRLVPAAVAAYITSHRLYQI
jgi:nicotinate-nucleotide adenylyltransferase